MFKKCLIGLMFLMAIIIPGYRVDAIILGNDNVNYPDKPNDGNDGYIIGYFWKYNSVNRPVYTTRLITFNTEEVKHVMTSHWNNGAYLYIQNTPKCAYSKDEVWNGLCSPDPYESRYANTISYTYDSSNDTWVLENEVGKRQYFFITKIFYSTIDIYYALDSVKSTYPEDSYFIPGEHDVPSTHPDTGNPLVGLESSYYDMTYEHNTGNDIITAVKKTGEKDSVYYTVSLDLYGGSIFLHNEYKTRVKVGSNEWIDLTSTFNIIDWANGEVTDNIHYEMDVSYEDVNYYETSFTYQVLDVNDNLLYEEVEELTGLMPELEQKWTSTIDSEQDSYLQSIDVYYDKEEIGRIVNFRFELIDNQNYVDCPTCIMPQLEKITFRYLLSTGDGLYVWKQLSTNDIGVSYDWNTPEWPENTGDGITLSGKLNLTPNETYSVEKIKVSFELSNAKKITYKYYDDSHNLFKLFDIDEYFISMLDYSTSKKLNRTNFDVNFKYTLFFIEKGQREFDMLVEYINTTNYLQLEYFDIGDKSYIEDGNTQLHINYFQFLENGRDFEAYRGVKIGPDISRALYALDRFKTEDSSMYKFYIPEDVYFSYSDKAEDSVYIDSNGNISTGFESNPEYDFENLDGPMDLVTAYFEKTGMFITDIFQVISYFLSELNPWIRISLEIIFWVLIITRIVKVARK